METERTNAIRHACDCESIEQAEIEMQNAGILTFGIESITVCGKHLRYVNLGDTYDYTVCEDDECGMFAGSWGGWAEKTEADFEQENDTIRCGYCGEFTPRKDNILWYNTECEHCGNCVAG